MKVSTPILVALLAAGTPLFLAQTASAPTPAQNATGLNEKDLVFHLDVRQVPVDVVVLDKKGNPVRGLKSSDFIVKENGKVQQVRSFDSFDGSKLLYKPGKLPPLPPNTFTNAPTTPERGPLYVLYYDLVNTSEENQMSFHRELLKFVDNAPVGTRIALFVNGRGLHLVQGFTSDHAALREAILKKGPGPHIPNVFMEGSTFGRYDAGAALSNLQFIAEYLNGIPGRKNLIWLSSYFPIPVGPTVASSPTGGAAAGQPALAGSTGLNGGPVILDLSYLLKDVVKRTYSAMMQSQVALYLVSVRGVAGAEASSAEADAMADYQNMDTIAAATGGHAYFSGNRESELIAKAIDHGETYYTLTYAPSNTRYDGSERTIQVSLVKNGDYKLTYRKLYYALSDDDVQKQNKQSITQARFIAAKTADTLYASIEHGAPILHDLLFSAQLSTAGGAHTATPEQMVALQDAPEYFQTRRKHPSKPLAAVKLQRYTIDYGVVDPQLKPTAAQRQKPAVLEFAAAAYNDDGRLLNSILNQGTPTGTPGKRDGVFHAIQELDAPPGTAFIRLAVRDTLTNRTGTLEVKLPLAADTPGTSAKAD